MSQKLALNFVEKSLFSLSNIHLFGLVLLVIGVIFSIFTWQSYISKDNEFTALENELQSIKHHKQADSQVKSIQTDKISDSEKQFLATLIATLSTSWEGLIGDVENTNMKDIALLSIEPNLKKQMISLTGEAKDFTTLLNYIQNLEAQPRLYGVFLQKHLLNESHQSKPVGFVIIAQWQEDNALKPLAIKQEIGE